MRAALLLFALLAAADGAAAAPAGLESAQPVPGAHLYARLGAERKALYLQEVFEFTVSVHSRGLTMGREISLRNQETPGLTFFPYVDLGSSREVVNGKAFEVRRFLGRAQAVATGSFPLQPEVRASVVLPGREHADVRETSLRPPVLPMEVRSLPEAGKPEGFSGAVGSFTFKASVRPMAAAVGEPVTLTMEIQGRGNLESVSAPQIPAVDRFRLYEPKVIRREAGTDRSPGRLVFEQAVVPRSTAATLLPAVTFSYFEPAQRTYRKLVAGPFPVRVNPGARADAVVLDAGPSGPAEKQPALQGEIAPPKGEPRRWSVLPARPWYGSLWLLALQLVPPGIVAALFLAVRRREELAGDVVKARRQLAAGAARSRLGAAHQALRDGERARFHEALWDALSAYFGHRLNLLPGQISREAVAEGLSRAGLAPGSVARIGEVFLMLEQARFSPRSSRAGRLSEHERERLRALLEELDRIVQSCEQAPT